MHVFNSQPVCKTLKVSFHVYFATKIQVKIRFLAKYYKFKIYKFVTCQVISTNIWNDFDKEVLTWQAVVVQCTYIW